MAKEKEITVNSAVNENEKSESAKLRDVLTGYYANNAINVFTKYARSIYDGCTVEKIAEICEKTTNFTIVYTQPTEDPKGNRYTLVSSKWNIERETGKRWYKITQVVETALNVKRSYDSYLRFLDDKENGQRRELLRQFKDLTPEQMLAALNAINAEKSK